jgi:multidrug efflux pump subunit AcrA (membrane-fusion protein)
MRIREQAIDAELADMGGRLPIAELAVDNLEWHADRARTMADAVRQADDLQQQAAAAIARGDTAAAATLTQRAAILRDDADVLAFVRARPPFVLDERALAEVGVTLEPGTLDVPMPELIDPNSPMNPLAATSSTGEGDAVAVAPTDLTTDEMLGFDMSGGDSQVVVPEESSDAQTEDAVSDDTSLGDSSFGDPSFGDAAFDQPAFDAPVFDEPMVDTALAQTDFGEPSEPTHDAGFDNAPFDGDAGFAEPLA